MAANLDVKCPNCSKVMKVPAEFVGRLVPCKNCQAPFEVADPKAAPARPAPAKPAATKPAVAAAKPAAKPAAPAAAAPPAANAPLAFKDEAPAKKHADDDDDDGANPYGVITAGDDIPRCPFCANELDPPDTKICMTCGYDLMNRRRRESKKVIELQQSDYIKHWIPGVVCVFIPIGLVALSVLSGLNMREWMTGGLLDSDEKNPITGQTKFYVGPICFNIWIWIMSAWFSFLCLRFAYRRLVINWKPEEVVVKK